MATESLIWEIGELQSTIKPEKVEALKNHFTAHIFSVRPPYGKFQIKKAHTCSYFCTYNPRGAGELHDPTGNRRFLPLTSTREENRPFNIDWNRFDVDMFWSQVLYEYRDIEKEGLKPEELSEPEQIYRDDKNKEQTEEHVLYDYLDFMFFYDQGRVEPYFWDVDKYGGVIKPTDILELLRMHDHITTPQKNFGKKMIAEYMLNRYNIKTSSFRRFKEKGGKEEHNTRGYAGLWLTLKFIDYIKNQETELNGEGEPRKVTVKGKGLSTKKGKKKKKKKRGNNDEIPF